MDGHHRVRALAEESGKLRRGRGARRQQIGKHAALQQLAGEISLRIDGHTDGDGGALANLVFQNAQGFVERGDEEVHDAVANGPSNPDRYAANCETLIGGMNNVKQYLEGEFEVRQDATANLPTTTLPRKDSTYREDDTCGGSEFHFLMAMKGDSLRFEKSMKINVSVLLVARADGSGGERSGAAAGPAERPGAAARRRTGTISRRARRRTARR